MTVTAGAAPAPAGQTKLGIFSWCLYDWAHSAVNTVIGTFVFSVYFSRGIIGDETEGAALWGFALGWAGIAVALISPVAGAVADRGGSGKPWLLVLTGIGAAATAVLWFAEPDPRFAMMVLVFMVIGTVCLELCQVFYNSMLTTVAPPGYRGRVSGWAWGLGYFGGLTCLALCLVGFIFPDRPWFGLDTDQSEHIRATALVVAVWFVVFSLPLALFTQDRRAGGLPLGPAVVSGLGETWRTLRDAVRQPGLRLFLIASMLWRDGLVTLFGVGALFAAARYGMDFDEIILFAIGLNVTAGAGAALFAFLDDRIGPKPVIVVSLAALTVLGNAILLVEDKAVFMALSYALGTFVGPCQAAGRTLMAGLAPADRQGAYFGLYALAGKGTAFLGPFLFGAIVAATGNHAAGLSVVVVFWLAGLLLLLPVKAGRPDRAPR